ncbi:DUF2490 domain-containing protein [Catalinimonas niigatensis]|uniref:DUF2490 domain-containing protein n=1 Tax=Catalinimonas niigatensis TaxID=1397264 RepID=UPI002666093A|nr:DUF2490 domain-containing protein [Catalinimonas niigatensis]WPP48448.1 DUF2490 domain-containing protein [Catalinimonas niigatensis]
MKRFILLIFICFNSIQVFSQDTDYGNWFIYFGNGTLNDKWSVWGEVQYRNFNFAGDLEQLLIRSAIQYQIHPNITLAQGLGFIWSQPYVGDEKINTYEYRPYQQIFVRNRFGRVYLNHRYRIEERILEDDFRVRLRYFLSLNIPLNKSTLEPGAVYLSAYNEVFIHTDSPVFDRNRLYGGLGYVFSPSVRMELSTMTQMQEQRSRGQFQIVLFHNFNL